MLWNGGARVRDAIYYLRSLIGGTAAAVSTNAGARFTDLLVFQRPRLTWIVDNSNSVEKTIANSAKLESVFNPLPFFLENDLSDLENFYIFGILIRHSFRFRIFLKSEEV